MNESSGGAVTGVPGVDLLRPLRRENGVEVWRARDLGDGGEVEVVLGTRRPEGEGAALARASTLLRRLDHPHLARVHRVVDLPGGRRALVTAVVGAPLPRREGRVHRLEAGQVVTLIVPLAQALAEVHRAGLWHGRVQDTWVGLDDRGAPRLGGLGLWLLDGERGAGGPAQDVRDLAALGLGLLDPAAADPGTRALAAVLRAGLPLASPGEPIGEGEGRSGGPAEDALRLAREVYAATPAVPLPAAVQASRPTAAAGPAPRGDSAPATAPVRASVDRLGRALPVPPRASAAAAEPVPRLALLPVAGIDPDPRRPTTAWTARRSRVGLPVTAVAIGVAVLALASAGGWVATAAWRGGGGSVPVRPVQAATASAVPAGDEAAPGPVDAVAGLAEARARVLERADAAALADVDVEGSPAMAADRDVVDELTRSGQRPVGARPELIDVTLVSWRDGAAVVEVSSRIPRHVRSDERGAPVATAAPGPVRTVRLVLRPGGPHGWRVWSVEPA